MTRWHVGDRVEHARRPEWGVGEIIAVGAMTVDGVSAQRLRVNFERGGIKSLSSAVAELRPAGAEGLGEVGGRSGGGSAGGGLAGLAALGAIDPNDVEGLEGVDSPLRARLGTLPESVTDLFSPALARLESAVDLYRFSEPGRVIDWAATVGGVTDPLSRLSRHDLEVLHEAFYRRLGPVLAALSREAGSADLDGARRALSRLPESARDVLRRHYTKR